MAYATLVLGATLLPSQLLNIKASKIVGNDSKVKPKIHQVSFTETSKEKSIVKEEQTTTPNPPHTLSSYEEMMTAAGISPQDFVYVDYIVTKESTWRVEAHNPSGATGLCQALPASKMASAGADYLTNPITQLKWCNSYAVGRYGSWAQAHAFWLAHKWW